MFNASEKRDILESSPLINRHPLRIACDRSFGPLGPPNSPLEHTRTRPATNRSRKAVDSDKAIVNGSGQYTLSLRPVILLQQPSSQSRSKGRLCAPSLSSRIQVMGHQGGLRS
jgi:hypothetical protein